MSTQLVATPAVIRVDGVEVMLDISRLTAEGQRVHSKLAASGEPYEPVMTRVLAKLLGTMKEPRFMDIGAYAGYYTCYVARLLGNGAGPVYSIDSNPIHCAGIKQSCELNGLENVEVYEAVLSDVPERVVVDSCGIVQPSTGATETALSITLEQLCERERIPVPNVIKMDIHGCEGKALFGMSGILQAMDYLLLELHGDSRLDQFSGGRRRLDVLQFLWGLGLSLYKIAGHRSGSKAFNTGRFAYRQLTAENADYLLFDRPRDVFLLVTRHDIRAALGESLEHPHFCLGVPGQSA